MTGIKLAEDEVRLLLHFRASSKASKAALLRFAESTSEYQQLVDKHGEAGPLLNYLLRNPDSKLNADDSKVVQRYLRAARHD